MADFLAASISLFEIVARKTLHCFLWALADSWGC